MTLERSDRSIDRRIPEARGLIDAPRSDACAVGRESQRDDIALMPLERGDELGGALLYTEPPRRRVSWVKTSTRSSPSSSSSSRFR